MQLEPLFTIYSLIETDIGVYALLETYNYYDSYFLAGQSTNLKLTCHMAKVLMNKLKFKYFFIFKPYDGTP